MAALFIVLIIMVIGLIQTVRYTRQAGDKDGLWLLYLAFVPPLFLFLFSQWRPVYIERALLPSGAMFCIWLAWVVVETNLAKAAQYALLGLFVVSSALGIYQHITYSDFPYGPFKELDASLRLRMEAQDVIVHSNKLSALPAILFDRDLPQAFIGDPPGSGADTLALATQETLEIYAEKDIQSATQNANRVWYIIYRRAIAEQQAAGHATHPDIEYLNAQYDLQSEENWGELKILLYTNEP
jgi:hypothetical protein